jgi:hypothetical protein
MQPARLAEPFFNHTATGDDFENALKGAARGNTRSMADLRDSIRKCMSCLRAEGMQCEQALLTMKAFVRETSLRHRKRGSREMLHSEMLMEQVVSWCIFEFYADAGAS